MGILSFTETADADADAEEEEELPLVRAPRTSSQEPSALAKIAVYAAEAWTPLAMLAFVAFFIFLGPNSDDAFPWSFTLGLLESVSLLAVCLHLRSRIFKALPRRPITAWLLFGLALVFAPLAPVVHWVYALANIARTPISVDATGPPPATIGAALFAFAGPGLDVDRPIAAATAAVGRLPFEARLLFSRAEPAWLVWLLRKFHTLACARTYKRPLESQAIAFTRAAVLFIAFTLSDPATVALKISCFAMLVGIIARCCRGPHPASAVAATVVAVFGLLASSGSALAMLTELSGKYHLGTKRLLFGSSSFGLSFPCVVYAATWLVVWTPLALALLAAATTSLWSMLRTAAKHSKVCLAVMLVFLPVFFAFAACGAVIFATVLRCSITVIVAVATQRTFGRPMPDLDPDPMAYAVPWRLLSDFLYAAPDERSFRRRVRYVLTTWYAEARDAPCTIGTSENDVLPEFVRDHLLERGSRLRWNVTRLVRTTILRRLTLFSLPWDSLGSVLVASAVLSPATILCDGTFALVVAYDAVVARLPGGGSERGRLFDLTAGLACAAVCLLPLTAVAIGTRLQRLRADAAASCILCTGQLTYAVMCDLICRYHRVPVTDVFGAAGAAMLTGRQRVCPGVPPEVLEGAVAPFLDWAVVDVVDAAHATASAADSFEAEATTGDAAVAAVASGFDRDAAAASVVSGLRTRQLELIKALGEDSRSPAGTTGASVLSPQDRDYQDAEAGTATGGASGQGNGDGQPDDDGRRSAGATVQHV